MWKVNVRNEGEGVEEGRDVKGSGREGGRWRRGWEGRDGKGKEEREGKGRKDRIGLGVIRPARHSRCDTCQLSSSRPNPSLTLNPTQPGPTYPIHFRRAPLSARPPLVTPLNSPCIIVLLALIVCS